MMLFVRLYKTTHRHKRGNKSVQVKFPDGSVLIAGTVVRDAEIKLVGEKQSALLKFGVAIGKRQDTTTIFVNCVCWRSLATSLVGVTERGQCCLHRSFRQQRVQRQDLYRLSPLSLSLALPVAPSIVIAIGHISLCGRISFFVSLSQGF